MPIPYPIVIWMVKRKIELTPIKRFETNPDIKLFLISLKAGVPA
jgi:hypothetical protein